MVKVWNSFSILIVLALLVLLAPVVVLLGPPVNVALAQPADWQYRKAITISSSQIDAGLTDFPVLISVTDTNLSDTAQSDGDDIKFTASDGTTQLPHEIEKYDNSTGELVAHVRVSSVSSSSDTVIYMYYGNAGASNQENVTAVWDSNYLTVQHFQETSGTHYDSTSYGNNVTPYVTTQGSASGKIDGADALDGTGDYMNFPMSILQDHSTTTIELWFKADATDYARHIIWAGDNAGNGWGTQSEMHISLGSYHGGSGQDNFLSAYLGDDSNYYWEPSDVGDPCVLRTSFSDTASWHHVAMTLNGSVGKLYLDSSEVNSTGYSGSISKTNWDASHIGSSDGERYFDGILDEVRISNTSRSQAWVKASYHSGNNSLLSFGSEEFVGGIGITVTPTSGLVTTEGGGIDTFTIVLNTQPSASVSIGLASSDEGEGTVAPSSVTFTTSDWDDAQTVTVTGEDDGIVDGPIAYTIITAPATGGDYNGIDAADVGVTNMDNDGDEPILDGQLTFPGNQAGRVMTVSFYDTGTHAEEAWSPKSATTDATGNFTITTGLVAGTYDISVKNHTCLSEVERGIVLVDGTTTYVNFGSSREGDSDNSDGVSIVDISILIAAYGTTPGDGNWNANCDYNRDSGVSITDISILIANYGDSGDPYP